MTPDRLTGNAELLEIALNEHVRWNTDLRVQLDEARAENAALARRVAGDVPPEFAAWREAVRENETAEAAWKASPRGGKEHRAAVVRSMRASGREADALAALRAAVLREDGGE